MLLAYVLKRVVLSILIIFGVIALSYVLIYIMPGNPAYTWVGKPKGPKAAEAIQIAVRELGLDKPFYIQLYEVTTRFFSFNWGVSLRFKQPVATIAIRSLVATLEALIIAYVIAIPLGILIGSIAALYRSSLGDKAIYTLTSILIASPRFWLAALTLIILQALNVNVFGRIGVEYQPTITIVTGSYIIDSLISGRIDTFLDALTRTLPPALLVSLYPFALVVRIVRISLSEKLHEEYFRQALSYGISGWYAVKRYALRSVIPVLAQIMGITIAYSLVDVATIESVFGREGVGIALAKAIPYNDYPLIIGLLTVVSIAFIISFTVADIVHKLVDPRVRI